MPPKLDVVDLADRTNYPYVFVWICAWLGTTLAGGVDGLISANVPGLFGGLLIAGAWSLPVLITIATLTWALWLSHYSPVCAATAGALTGLTSAAGIWIEEIFTLGYVPSILLATFLGGLGSAWLSHWYWTQCALRGYRSTERSPWQFSMRDLLLRFMVLSILLTAWTFAASHVLQR